MVVILVIVMPDKANQRATSRGKRVEWDSRLFGLSVLEPRVDTERGGFEPTRT